MELLKKCVVVGAGGFVGAIARYLIGIASPRIFGAGFPTGTFIINITGSLLLGWFAALSNVRPLISENVRLAIAVGFVGAYTTFSTFMYESNALVQDGSGLKATVNLVGSVVLGLIAVRLGMWIGAR